jgi:hypothetical protein
MPETFLTPQSIALGEWKPSSLSQTARKRQHLKSTLRAIPVGHLRKGAFEHDKILDNALIIYSRCGTTKESLIAILSELASCSPGIGTRSRHHLSRIAEVRQIRGAAPAPTAANRRVPR